MSRAGRGDVSSLVAAARRELDDAKASLSRGDDCVVALEALARAEKMRNEAIVALLDVRSPASHEPKYTHAGYMQYSDTRKENQMSDTLIYTVPGMHCGHCERAVSEEVSAVSGVESVAVNLDSKSVTVVGTALDDAKLRAAIDEAGYKAA
jgi:copper chaperone